MEYVGRKVKKEFEGRGTLCGSVQAYEPTTGCFKIMYDDVGDSEDLRLPELHSLLAASEGEQNKRCRVFVDNDEEGKVNDNSVTAGSDGYSDLVGEGEGEGGVSGEFDLDLNAGVDLDEEGFCCLNDDSNNVVVGDQRGSEVKLHGLDLNKGVEFELEGVDVDKAIVNEECSGVKNELIDLNLAVNEDSESLSGEGRGRGFDLNLESMEDDVRTVVDCEGQFGAYERVSAQQDGQVKGELMEDCKREILSNVDDGQGNEISNVENKEEDLLKNFVSGVENEDVTTVSTSRKRRGRKRKDALNNGVELVGANLVKVEVGATNIQLDPESKDVVTPVKNNNELCDDANGISSIARTRSGRKRRELLENNVTLRTPETGLRRSSRTAKRVALPSQDHVVNVTRMDCINDQILSPALNAAPGERLMVVGCGKPVEHVSLPPKVELPPSTSNLDLHGIPVFNFVSVYAFLRSFSTLLFLSPFELDDFLASVMCNDATLLFDSIHVSLLRTLKKHLEPLSVEGSVSASDCLRCLNWDFLDLITWPMFVVEYLLLHSPGYIPGLDMCHLKTFPNNYYELPASAKVEILRHLCDDVIEAEAFRLELNKRTLATDRRVGFERNMNSESSRKRKGAIGIASNSCITEEDIDVPADWNSDECCLCKMEGDLICCDGCPAAFHTRCVGVVSSLLPEGDWFCPECAIQRDRPWMNLGKSIRGAELLGIDPYGRLYYSSCDFLLVLESSDDDYSCRSYNRNNLPGLVEVLRSTPFIYDAVINAICKHWNIVKSVGGARNNLDSLSYSIQSAFPGKRQLLYIHPTPSEILNEDKAVAEKRSDGNSIPAYLRNLKPEDTKQVTVLPDTGNHGAKDNQVASSEGSAEVSQAFTKPDTLKETGLDNPETCSEVPDYSQIALNVEQGNIPDSANDSCAPSVINSSRSSSQVHRAIKYVNCYEFARTASSVFEGLTCKSSDKISVNAPKSVEEVIAGQVKIVSNRFAKFSWSNIQNLNVKIRKEKCGWCFYCKAPEFEMDCLFIKNSDLPAADNFTSEALGIQLSTNKANHLIDIICHMICIEDHLQGLILGPWLNPHYSSLWRKNAVEVSNIASLKNLLLKLESNLHPRVVSNDWEKHVDSVPTMGSASHIVSSSARAASKLGTGKRRANCSELRPTPSSNSATGLSLFWWRGGKSSRKLFSWKVLPHSLVSKAARQGGCKRIPGVLYPDVGENAKRTKCASWRAAVETSRSVEQLALQIRELDANVRWDEIGNTHLLSKMDKESQKSARSFKKVIIRKKCSEGTVVRYLLDFGKRRFIPDVVVKHGAKHEDSTKEKKKYWLEEPHVPLYLLKAFEERRIARKSSKMTNEKLSKINRVTSEPFKKKGFAYLFSKAELSQSYQCGHCIKDVRIREAVSCQYCKGFFHKRHVRKSDGSVPAECVYTCHKCWSGKLVNITERKRKPEAPKLKNVAKRLKRFHSGKGKKSGKEKQSVNSKSKNRVALVVPLRRSARYAERVSKLPFQNTKGKKRKRGKQTKSRKTSSKTADEFEWKKKGKRAPLNSSYWLNGLRFSRRPDDDRLVHLRSTRLLVLSGEASSIGEQPQCCLCGELEYSSNMNYVACEICGAWFHGDALDLSADKVKNLIGIKCHKCLNKRLPVCPHICSAESDRDKLNLENSNETQSHLVDRSADQNSQSNNEPNSSSLAAKRQ